MLRLFHEIQIWTWMSYTSFMICVQVSLAFWETCHHLLVVSPSNRSRMIGTVNGWLGRPVKVLFTSVSGAIVTGWDDVPSSNPIFTLCSLASWLTTTGRACLPDMLYLTEAKLCRSTGNYKQVGEGIILSICLLFYLCSCLFKPKSWTWLTMLPRWCDG